MDPFSSGSGGGSLNVEIFDGNPLQVRGVQINQGALQSLAIHRRLRPNGGLRVINHRRRACAGRIENRMNVPLSDAVLAMGNRYLQLGLCSRINLSR